MKRGREALPPLKAKAEAPILFSYIYPQLYSRNLHPSKHLGLVVIHFVGPTINENNIILILLS